MKTVLLIEDEAVLRIGTARGLSKLPGVDVIAVGSMGEATEVLDTVAPALVISDLDLPDRIGLEILGELGRRDQHPPVIFVTAFLRAFRSQIPRHARVTVFEKPLELDRLRAQVTATLGLSIVGAPAPFTPADYLQLACMGNHSVEIELVRGDGTGGRVIVVHGEAWSAHDERGDGEAAFARLAFANDGLVTCRTLVGAPGNRDLTRSWEGMLMDAARELDELRRSQPSAPPPDEPLAFEPPAFEPPAFEPPARVATAPVADYEITVLPPRQAVPVELPEAPTTESQRYRLEAHRLEGHRAEPFRVEPHRAEGHHPHATTPHPHTVPRARATEPVEPPPPPPLDPYLEAWDLGVSALLRKDYETAWAAFAEALALRPNDAKAKANLARLRDLGHGGPAADEETMP